jgi:hypothetical protein
MDTEALTSFSLGLRAAGSRETIGVASWGACNRARSCRLITTTSSDHSNADMGFTTNVNLARVPDEIHEVSADFAVASLPPLGTGR